MKDRYLAVVIILLLLLFAVVGVALMSKKIGDQKKTERDEQAYAELCSKLNGCDVTIYWIGDFPQQLSSVRSKCVFPEVITEETMPMVSPGTHIVERDPDGNIVKELIPVEYTEHLYIIINKRVLTEDEYSVIRDCIRDNGVRALVFGRDAVNAFRNFLILIPMEYKENDSMAFSMDEGAASYIIKDCTDYSEMITYLLGDMEKHGDRFIENNTDHSEG